MSQSFRAAKKGMTLTTEDYHGSAALVGPLRTVRFHDGARMAADPPRDTLDPRYLACRSHRVACDCREAEHAGMIAEYRNRLREIERAAAVALRGHFTYAYDEHGEIDLEWLCGCAGCDLARASHEVRTMADQEREGTTLYPRLRLHGLSIEIEREYNLLNYLRDERQRAIDNEEPPF